MILENQNVLEPPVFLQIQNPIAKSPQHIFNSLWRQARQGRIVIGRFNYHLMAHDYLAIYDRIIKPEPDSLALTDGDLNWMKLAPPSSTT